MGRGRLRRGFSLEVIFEEDSDFCSHLDSLDSRGIRRDCRDREEFSIDSLWEEFHPHHHHLKGRPSGGIKDPTFFPHPQTQFNGFDDTSDMEFVEWDEFSPEEERGEREGSVPRSSTINSSDIGNGRRSRVSRREILERNWQLGSDPEEDGDSDDTVRRKPIDIAQKKDRGWESEEETTTGWNPYISQDETDSSDNYAFADPADDVTSFASTSFDSSPSSPNGCSGEKSLSIRIGSTRASLDVNGDDEMEFDGKKRNSDPPASLLTTDVKKVRALFELQTTPTIQPPSGLKEGKRRLENGENRRNPESENERKMSRERTEADFLTLASGTGFVSSIRSAFSQMSINQLGKHDFVDLLSNDKVVIEDTPDIFQTLRSRGRECPSEYSSSGPLSRSGASTLRRSKSMGTGISKIGFSGDTSTSSSCEELKRPCIIAEEMPAPDTVKNVRTVFEKMLSRPRVRNSSSEDHYIMANGSSSISINANFSSVKSNPTSKILRSESMREKEDSQHGSRFAKPIFSNASGKNSNQVNSTGKDRKPTLTRKFSEPIATLAKNFQNGGPAPMPLSNPHLPSSSVHNGKVLSYNGVGSVCSSQSSASEDELPSLVSSVGSLMDNGGEDVKMIPQEVLNRIRSCGTTTTYFGGQIVSKTVKNRKLPLPDQAPPSAFNPFHSHSTSPNYIPEERIPLTTSSRKSAEGTEFGHNPNYPHFEEHELSPPPSRPAYPYSLPLEILGQFMGPRGDTTPRIISVLPKSPQSSPSKSPVLMEGRNSPEGCENIQPEWINEISSESKENGHSICSHKFSSDQDTNNNCNGFVSKVLVGAPKKEMEDSDKKFSQVTPGAWF